MRPIFYGWWIVIATFTLVLCAYGTYYTLPVFYPALKAEFTWSRTQLSGVGSLVLLATGLFSPIAGWLTDHYGARVSLALGSSMSAAALLCMSALQKLSHLYLAAILFGVGMAGLSVLPVQMLIAKWFVRRRGLATGIVISGMGLGGTVGSVVVAALVAAQGWRSSFLYEGVFLFLSGLLLAIFVLREAPSERGLDPDGGLIVLASSSTGESGTPGLSFPEALRSSAFWLLGFSSFCATSAGIGVIQHLVLYMGTLKYELPRASLMLSTLLFSSVLGRAGFGWLSDWLSRRHTLVLAYCALGLGTTLLVLGRGKTALLVMAITVGLGYGGSIVLLALTAVEVFGTKSLGKILGTLLIFFTAGGSLGPVLVGVLSDHFGNYYFGFLPLPAVAFTGAALLLIMPKPPIQPVTPG